MTGCQAVSPPAANEITRWTTQTVRASFSCFCFVSQVASEVSFPRLKSFMHQVVSYCNVPTCVWTVWVDWGRHVSGPRGGRVIEPWWGCMSDRGIAQHSVHSSRWGKSSRSSWTYWDVQNRGTLWETGRENYQGHLYKYLNLCVKLQNSMLWSILLSYDGKCKGYCLTLYVVYQKSKAESHMYGHTKPINIAHSTANCESHQ